MTTSEQNGNVMPSIPAHYEGKLSSKSRSTSKSTPDDWCRLIFQNHIMPALFDHDFGGNREGVLGACPFEVLCRFQLGLLKYILTSLFHYCTVPCHFQEWLDKRSSPDVPSIELLLGSISTSCPPSNEYDSPDGGHTKGGRKRK